MKHPHQAYAKASHTLSKTRQVVMLYEGAIRFLQQAMEAIRDEAPDVRYARLERASEIIIALREALDMTGDSPEAKRLHGFYTEIDHRILMLQRSHNLAECTSIIDALRPLRDAWDVIDRGERG